jgi:hypothetical protein
MPETKKEKANEMTAGEKKLLDSVVIINGVKWLKVTQDQVDVAQGEGTLAGYRPFPCEVNKERFSLKNDHGYIGLARINAT